MLNYRAYAVAYKFAYPKRSDTEAGNANYKRYYGKALIPCSVGELEVLGIGACAVKNLTHKAQDVNRRYNDTRCGHDGEHATECIGVFKRTHEDCHLGNEAAEARQTEVGKTGNHIANGKERHDTRSNR